MREFVHSDKILGKGFGGQYFVLKVKQDQHHHSQLEIQTEITALLYSEEESEDVSPVSQVI